MSGEKPPATAAESWAPSDAPLYLTLVPKSSEKKAPCGAYIGACEQRNTSSSASHTSGVDQVSHSPRLFHLRESRRLEHFQADDETDADQHNAHQERHTPSPGEELIRW